MLLCKTCNPWLPVWKRLVPPEWDSYQRYLHRDKICITIFRIATYSCFFCFLDLRICTHEPGLKFFCLAFSSEECFAKSFERIINNKLKDGYHHIKRIFELYLNILILNWIGALCLFDFIKIIFFAHFEIFSAEAIFCAFC